MNILQDQKNVEYLIDKKLENSKIYFLVKWLGKKIEDSTWEPMEHIMKNLIKGFHKKRIQKEKFSKIAQAFSKSEKKSIQKTNQTNSEYKEIYQKEKKGVENEVIEISDSEQKSPQKEIQTINTKVNNKTKIDFSIHIGCFHKKDVVDRIITVQKDEILKEVFAKVGWKTRQDNFKPQNAWISANQIKKYQPSILFDFYEDRITLVPKNYN